MYNAKCLIYSRVSSDEQRQKGYSLDFQYKEELEYCKRAGLVIDKHFTESHTAKRPGRPQFNEMLAYAHKNKIFNLVFLKNDRASRNPVDSAALSFMAEHQGFYIHLIQDNLILSHASRPQDFLIFEINNGFSNLYSRNLSVEVRSKMLEKAEQGYYPSKPMVGYKTDPKAKRKYLLVDEEKAPYIRDIFELYATNKYSFSTLAAEMRSRGFKVTPSKYCTKRNIEEILKNPVYVGDFIWKGKRYYNAKHTPLVDKGLFYYVQRLIKERTTTVPNNHKNFLFTSLIKCSHCGCALVGELKKGKYIYYHCTGNRGGDCKRKYLKEAHAEELFLEVLNNLKISDEAYKLVLKLVKSKILEEKTFSENQAKELQVLIDKTNARLNKLLDLYIDEKLDDIVYNKKRQELQDKLDSLNFRLAAMNNSQAKTADFSKNILELLKAAPDMYLSGDIEYKRNLIKLLCSNFLYDGENLTIVIKKAFQPLVGIANLLNGGLKGAKLELLVNNFIQALNDPDIFVLNKKISEFLAA